MAKKVTTKVKVTKIRKKPQGKAAKFPKGVKFASKNIVVKKKKMANGKTMPGGMMKRKAGKHWSQGMTIKKKSGKKPC